MSAVQLPSLRLGFMGFGEAAYLFATDLSRAGVTSMVAYSRSGAKAQPGDVLHVRAQQAGVQLVKTAATLAKHADVIIGMTPGKSALAAVKKIHLHLQPHHVYADASASSVKAMEQAAALIGDSANFVDAAIMGPVTVSGFKIPIVASGARAEAFRDALTPFGMNIKVISKDPGTASAMKLIRSVCMKGLSSLLFESLEAAHKRGILELCAEDLAATFDDIPFQRLIKRSICGTATHAPRRIHEMQESLDVLQASDVYDRMTRATLAFHKDMAKSGLPQKFPREPDSIKDVLDAWAAADR